MWKRKKRRGEHLYRSGPAGRAGWGRAMLPGILASTELSEHEDGYGRPFALVSVPKAGTYTVVFGSEPDGESLVDRDQIEAWVAAWGAWLAELGRDPQIMQAQVVIETAPDTGARLSREIAANVVEDAPPLALTMLEEVASAYPVGGAAVRAYVAITVAAAAHAGAKARTRDEVAHDLAAKVGTWSWSLASTGAGMSRPIDAEELVRAVRCAYDPAAEALFDDAFLAGDDIDASWEDAGPVAAEAGWDWYRHDSGVSETWVMMGAPKGVVYSTVLANLLSPDATIARKRVSMTYRTIDAGRAADIVEKDANQASSRVQSARRTSAKDQAEFMKADATRFEEANGAGLVDFGMIVTATATGPEGLVDLRERISTLASSARLVLRPAYGMQDSAFACALPLGLVASRYSRVPEFAKEMM